MNARNENTFALPFIDSNPQKRSLGKLTGIRAITILAMAALLGLCSPVPRLATAGSTPDAQKRVALQAPKNFTASDNQAELGEAKALLDKSSPTDAEVAVRQYLSGHPRSADAHFLLGYILFREVQETARARAVSPEGKQPSAEPKASNVGSRDALAKASLAEFTEGAKYNRPGAFDLKIVALDYILLADYVDADKWLTRALEWSPSDAEGWYDLGRVKYNEDRFEEAVTAFQKSLSLKPRDVKAEDNVGLSYFGLGRINEATTAYANAIAWQNQEHLTDSGPFINMASLLLDQNRSAESLSYLRRAIEIDPGGPKGHELLGKAYTRLNQLAPAQAELEKAIQLDPENSSLPCMLAPVYRREGLMDKAEAQLDRCAGLNGTHSSPETPRP